MTEAQFMQQIIQLAWLDRLNKVAPARIVRPEDWEFVQETLTK